MRNLLFTPLAALLFSCVLSSRDAEATKPAAKAAWPSADACPLDPCVGSGQLFAGDKLPVVEVKGRRNGRAAVQE